MSVSVKYGVNVSNLDTLVGKTIAEVRDSLGSLLHIPEDAQVRINNAPVGDDYVVADGNNVEFVKVAGEKGAVTVKYGVNNMQVDSVDGQTIGELYEAVGSLLHIPEDTEVRVDNRECDDDTIVGDNCTVEWVKVAGEKGK